MKAVMIFSILMICLTFVACEEKAPLLEGDIHGKVGSVVNSYGFSVSDLSGIEVHLTGENIDLETTTDSYGQYVFQDLPFGNYYINLAKENYVQYDLNQAVGHVGGDAPTVVSQRMNEVPAFYYVIDSMTYIQSHFNIYIHMVGATSSFSNRFIYIHCFFSTSPDVSFDNYRDSFLDFYHPSWEGIFWVFYYSYYNFLNDYPGTVYCRIYPQTECNDMWYSNNTSGPHPIYPETLGLPSEVFSFTVEGITRTGP